MDYFLKYCLYVLILSVLMGISTWKLFKKMGFNPLFAFVPFYNYYIIQKEAGHPKWWVVMAYFPIVGPIMMTVFHLFLLKKFGKSSFIDKLLTVFLPFIYMAYVNYVQNPEIQKNEEEFLLPGEEKVQEKESFLGSITFAVVFATIIHVFVTQPFGIPTGSMERTLLVGDFLFVNKWSYGYRMPMRPIALPFLQGTITDTGEKNNPKDDPKSYADAIKLPYWRILQMNKPERYDIVVFNYPQDSVHVATDRKDPYVKRCIGVPGDIVEFKNANLFINGQPEKILGDEQQQRSYAVLTGTQLDVQALYKKYGFLPLTERSISSGYEYDFQGLTRETAAGIKAMPEVVEMKQKIFPKDTASVQHYLNAERSAYSQKIDTTQSIFPINKPWNPSWYGPLRVPKKGDVVTLNQNTLPEYRWIITEYEHHHLENKDGKIFIDGKETDKYTIQQDYYMMCGDNRDASLDARFFGFVPEENIIGKPMFTWMSLQGVFKDANSDYQAPFKVRWDRMFKATNTGEKEKTSYWWVAAIVLVLFFGWDYFVEFFKKEKKEN